MALQGTDGTIFALRALQGTDNTEGTVGHLCHCRGTDGTVCGTDDHKFDHKGSALTASLNHSPIGSCVESKQGETHSVLQQDKLYLKREFHLHLGCENQASAKVSPKQ